MIPKGRLTRAPSAYASHVRRRLELEQSNVTTLMGALLDGEAPRLAPATDVAPSEPCRLSGSCACRQIHFSDPWYGYDAKLVGDQPRFHRKQWEFHYILSALRRYGMLAEGKRGLGFGVGREPLASLFAALGPEIVATDMDRKRAVKSGWAESDEHAEDLAALNEKGLCPPELFAKRVSRRTVDMNRIPEDLRGFDFCWSACALEHLGSVEHGLVFVEKSLACLRPGGVGVHTSELNLTSNEHTLDYATTVIPRRRDYEALAERLRRAGHELEPLDFEAGDAPLDRFVDVPPYRVDGHLKLLLERYTSTSFGITVRRGG
jgi:hypothetical protein